MDSRFSVKVNEVATINFSKKDTTNKALVDHVNSVGKTTLFVEGDENSGLVLRPCGGKGNPYMVVAENGADVLKGLIGETVELHVIAQA